MYRGKLKTDFEEDYNKLLSAINIGQQIEPINERKGVWDSQKANVIDNRLRSFGRILPIEGKWYYTTWKEGQDWGYQDGDYYYY